MPYCAQERIGRSLVRRACRTGKKRAIRTAVAQAGALVFEMGSTTPFLRKKFQDMRFLITDRVINGSPVWAAVDGTSFMYRCDTDMMMISVESDCAKGRATGYIYNMKASSVVVAPTELPSDKWFSNSRATLESRYASAEHCCSGGDLGSGPQHAHHRGARAGRRRPDDGGGAREDRRRRPGGG
jgi:hypothetical protein